MVSVPSPDDCRIRINFTPISCATSSAFLYASPTPAVSRFRLSLNHGWIASNRWDLWYIVKNWTDLPYGFKLQWVIGYSALVHQQTCDYSRVAPWSHWPHSSPKQWTFPMDTNAYHKHCHAKGWWQEENFLFLAENEIRCEHPKPEHCCDTEISPFSDSGPDTLCHTARKNMIVSGIMIT